MRGRAKLFCLLGSDSGRHVECYHQLVVAELLVKLQLGDEAVGEGDDGLDAVLQLAVAEVLQKLAHLENKRPIMCCLQPSLALSLFNSMHII